VLTAEDGTSAAPNGDPRYIVDLLARIVTVSLESIRVVDSLPSLGVRHDR
jgi:predicted helicase